MRQPLVNGETRLVGVIGWPVAHSRSPQMHNRAFAALGLNYVYVPLPVHPARLADAIRGLSALGFAGANVTVPHKSAVLPFVHSLTPIAAALGAANTLVVQPDDTILADNTDGAGLLADLQHLGFQPAGRQVLLLGAGGAARAVAYALAEAGAAISVANRTHERAVDLCEMVRQALPQAQISAHRFPGDLSRLAPSAELIINATSLGLHNAQTALPWDADVPFRADQLVYDLVYAASAQAGAEPALSPLLALAAAAGARTADGLGMLVQQGARAFELWTGRPAPIEAMAQAAAEPHRE